MKINNKHTEEYSIPCKAHPSYIELTDVPQNCITRKRNLSIHVELNNGKTWVILKDK